MKKLLLCVLTAILALLPLRAQEGEPYAQLGAKLEEYFTALAGESAQVQNAECDFLISSCQDSLVRQYVALKVYEHYLGSRIMGDDAVAVHVARRWFLSGEVPMKSSGDLFNAQLFVEFNQGSLIGCQAPVLRLFDGAGGTVRVPAQEGYSVLYFYDTSCSTCKVETVWLKQFVAAAEYPVQVFAIYVGASREAWDAYKADFPGVTHLWDPEVESDWQRLYGVLKTPRMFLVNPAGVIVGRGLDTPALRILLNREFAAESYVYGEASQMERFGQLFAAYGDSLQVQDVLDVADYLAARTFGEGELEAFKQTFGDLLYYLSSQKTEVFRDAAIPFVQRYIQLPDVWSTPEDQAQVVSLGEMLSELAARTPAGSPVPDLTVHGELRRRPCLFAPTSRSGAFSLRRLRGAPGYLVFYTGGCSSCQDILAAVDALVSANRRARVLLVDMDALMSDHPAEAQALLDAFDLSGLPMVVQLDKKGIVQHRYVQL